MKMAHGSKRTALLLSLFFLCAATAAISEIVPGASGPCAVIQDSCFAALEKEHLTRGGIGAHMRASKEAGDAYAVVRVKVGGPAEQAGLRTGDRVIALNGRKLLRSSVAANEATATFFSETHLNLLQNQKVVYTVERSGAVLDIEATAGPRSLEAAIFYLRAYLIMRQGAAWGQAYHDYVARNHPSPQPPESAVEEDN